MYNLEEEDVKHIWLYILIHKKLVNKYISNIYISL